MQLALIFDRPAQAASRKEAVALGLKTYFSGRPCKHGNVAARYTVGNGCHCEPCKAERRDRASAWNKANPERFAELQAKHQGKPEYRERAKASHAAYRKANAAKIAAGVRAWQQRNPERGSAIKKRWAEKNPERLKLLSARGSKKRAQAIQRATPPWWSKWDRFVLQEAKELAELRTKLTGFVWEQDHIIPLQGRLACGLHCAANIQVIPRALNHWKRNHMRLTQPGEWIKHL